MKKIAIIALAMTLVACGGSKKDMPAASNDFPVVKVTTTSADLSTSYPATIKGMQDIEIHPKVSGHIVRVLVDEGATVRAGQTLFQIDATQYKAQVAQCEAQIRVIKSNMATQELTLKNKEMLLDNVSKIFHQRGEMLLDKQIISQYDYDLVVNQLKTLRAQLDQAQAALQAARDQLHFCNVTSPSAGVVGSIPYRVGSLVGPSTPQPLTTVSNISQMYVYFSMTEKQLLGITSEGTVSQAIQAMPAVELVMADGNVYSQKGAVTAISGVIDQATGAVQMRATFDNAGHVLRSGGTGSIKMPVRAENVILIPQKATYDIQNKKFVYVVGADNVVKSREVEVLVQNDGNNYVVTSGLKAGERIVVEGVTQLKNGTKINPITPKQAEANRAKAKKALEDGKMPGEN